MFQVMLALCPHGHGEGGGGGGEPDVDRPGQGEQGSQEFLNFWHSLWKTAKPLQL